MNRVENGRRLVRLHAESELSFLGVLLWVASCAVLVVLPLVNAPIGEPHSGQSVGQREWVEAPAA